MLGRMIALHHRMTQNAADMMQLIQETLNQADEAHSRRIHGGHDGAWHPHLRGLSLAESSRPRAHDHARLDEVEPPGPGIRHSVNSEDLADPPPLADAQSLQLHVDHQRNAVVNRASRRPMFPAPSWTRVRPVGAERSGSSERTHSPEPPARPVPRTPAPAPVSPCVGPFSSPESLPEAPARAHSDAGNPGTPPEVPRAWTEEDDQQLCSLKADNRSKYSYKSLAKKLNRSIADVTQRWRSLERLRKLKEQHQKATISNQCT